MVTLTFTTTTTVPVLSLTITKDEGISGFEYAPHAVEFSVAVTGSVADGNVTANYKAHAHEVVFVHDFGDVGATFTVPTNLVTEHKNRNKGYGAVATHVYRTAGTYFHYVYAYDAAGNWGSASSTVTCIADDFTSAETIVISSAGDYTGAPTADVANQVTTWAAAKSLITASQWSGKKWKVWLKRGDTYTLGSSDNLILRGYSGAVFDAWGSGARPILDVSGLSTAESSFLRFWSDEYKTYKFKDLVINGDWDSTNDACVPSGTWRGAPFFGTFKDVVIDNVLIDGVNGCSSVPGIDLTSTYRIVFHEVEHTNASDFLVFAAQSCPNQKFMAIGCKMHDPLAALNGSENRYTIDEWYARNSHFGIRLDYAKTLEVSNCDIFSKHGWTLQYIFLDNPPLRLGRLELTQIKASTIEGFIAHGQTGTYDMEPNNLIISNSHIIMDMTHDSVMFVKSSGLTMRDNIITVPNGSAPTGSLMQPLIQGVDPDIGVPATNPDFDENPVRIYNNTVVNLRPSAQFGTEALSDFTLFVAADVTVENNIYYLPNLTVPKTTDGPLNTSTIGYEARYPGVARGWERTSIVLGSDIADGATLTVPYWNDWYGNPLTQSSFSGSYGRDAVVVGATTYTNLVVEAHYAGAGQVDTAAGVTGIEITNNSGVTWTSGTTVVVHVDRGSSAMAMDTTYSAPAGTTSLYRITASSGAYEQAATGLVSPIDFFGNPRRGSVHPDAAAGTPSRGALEPA